MSNKNALDEDFSKEELLNITSSDNKALKIKVISFLRKKIYPSVDEIDGLNNIILNDLEEIFEKLENSNSVESDLMDYIAEIMIEFHLLNKQINKINEIKK
tara:strand:- start:81056 stop:81358 length:303 start_codon:yes stop_codon:yes gene_type:complete